MLLKQREIGALAEALAALLFPSAFLLEHLSSSTGCCFILTPIQACTMPKLGGSKTISNHHRQTNKSLFSRPSSTVDRAQWGNILLQLNTIRLYLFNPGIKSPEVARRISSEQDKVNERTVHRWKQWFDLCGDVPARSRILWWRLYGNRRMARKMKTAHITLLTAHLPFRFVTPRVA